MKKMSSPAGCLDRELLFLLLFWPLRRTRTLAPTKRDISLDQGSGGPAFGSSWWQKGLLSPREVDGHVREYGLVHGRIDRIAQVRSGGENPRQPWRLSQAGGELEPHLFRLMSSPPMSPSGSMSGDLPQTTEGGSISLQTAKPRGQLDSNVCVRLTFQEDPSKWPVKPGPRNVCDSCNFA
jgi:hypothetical protein